MARDCSVYANVQIVFIPFFLLWLLALGYWVYNTFRRNAAHANNLHKGLTWLPAVECVYTFLCIFYYAACPWESFGSQLVAAALLMVVILKEPLNLLCLLLVAKGWCITRDSLSYAENRVIVLTVLLLYSAVVFELFAPDNRSAGARAAPAGRRCARGGRWAALGAIGRGEGGRAAPAGAETPRCRGLRHGLPHAHPASARRPLLTPRLSWPHGAARAPLAPPPRRRLLRLLRRSFPV